MSLQLFFVPPMECTEVRRVENIPTGDDWQYEVKFDGYRCIALKERGDVELFSRRGNPFKQFVNLFGPLRTQSAKLFIVDGEIVALHESGHFNFNALQNWGRSGVKVHFYIFDLLHLNGKDLLSQPLVERQRILHEEFTVSDYIHLPSVLDAALCYECLVLAVPASDPDIFHFDHHCGSHLLLDPCEHRPTLVGLPVAPQRHAPSRHNRLEGTRTPRNITATNCVISEEESTYGNDSMNRKSSKSRFRAAVQHIQEWWAGHVNSAPFRQEGSTALFFSGLGGYLTE